MSSQPVPLPDLATRAHALAVAALTFDRNKVQGTPPPLAGTPRPNRQCAAPSPLTTWSAPQLLASDLTTAITSETLHVDAGFHIDDMIFH